MDSSDPENERPEPTRGGGCSWPAAIAVVAIACIAAILLFYFMQKTFAAPGAVGRGFTEAAAKLGNLLGSSVKIDNQSVTLESKPILELATVKHRIVCVTKYTTTWAGSTATIIVRGVYTAKAGFALEKGTSFRFDDQGQIIDETIPQAQILSVEGKPEVFYDSLGVLKGLSGKDYEEAFRQNQQQARVEAEATGIREEARTRLKERLQDVLPVPAQKGAESVAGTPKE